MEILLPATVILAFVILMFWPLQSKQKKVKRSKRYRTSGAMLFGIQEIFQPTAANAVLIQEQKTEAGKPKPSPEDLL
jgi:hypothetical protein